MKKPKEIPLENPNLKRLTARQKLFVDRCFQAHTYRTHTDAYISVYRSSGNRRHDMINASRIYNRPSTLAYVEKVQHEEARLAAIESRREHQAFLASLKMGGR